MSVTPKLEFYNFNINIEFANTAIIFEGTPTVQITWNIKGRVESSKIEEIWDSTNEKTLKIPPSLLVELLYLKTNEETGENGVEIVGINEYDDYLLRYYTKDANNNYILTQQGNPTYMSYLPEKFNNEELWFYYKYSYTLNNLTNSFDKEFGILASLAVEGYDTVTSSITKQAERIMELTKPKIMTYSPISCEMKDGWYNNNSSGINLNNNDIVKVNGLFFNEDAINNIGEGIQFYNYNNIRDKHNFDILYGKGGEVYYVKNPDNTKDLEHSEQTRLIYSAGRELSIEGDTPIYGHITSSKRKLCFLIPLAKPITNYTNIELKGCFLIRGIEGYLAHPDGEDKASGYAYDDYGPRIEIGEENNNNYSYLPVGDTYRRLIIPKSLISLNLNACGLSVVITLPENKEFKGAVNNTPITLTPVARTTGKNLEGNLSKNLIPKTTYLKIAIQ